jgi:hypothetical protein
MSTRPAVASPDGPQPFADAPLAFHYRARFASRAFVPGAHASRVAGSGLDVAGVVPLARARDPRRLDVPTSLRDPFGHWWAREHRQRSVVPVLLLADASASMDAHDAALGQAAHDFARSLQHATAQAGDPFGLLAFDERVHDASMLRPTRSRAAAAAALQAWRASAHAPGANASGVLQAAALLPRERALVFLLSDFCWPLPLLDAALGTLARHDVVPVWLSTARPPQGLPARGLVDLRDAESGAQRLLWLRPAVRARWQAALAAHEQAVTACFARHHCVPLRLAAPFDADAVSRHFVAQR